LRGLYGVGFANPPKVRTYSRNQAQTIRIVAAFDWRFGAHLFGSLAIAWGCFANLPNCAETCVETRSIIDLQWLCGVVLVRGNAV